MYLPGNLKILRKRKKFTQNTVANSLKIKRSTYNGYENNIASPSLPTLIKLSDFLDVSIDVLLKTDLSKFSERELKQLEDSEEVFIKGSNVRILSHTINDDNEENVEVVSLKAKAGYTTGYADPEFIKVLPTFRLPFLSKNRKYRCFQTSGDSMEPIPHGAYVIAENVQNWYSLKDGEMCIILTVNEGIVFKCIENKLKARRKLGLYSLNTAYEPYTIDARDIKEVWRFVRYITDKTPEIPDTDVVIHQEILKIGRELNDIKKRIK